MEITKKQTKEIDIIEDIICDCCGKSCKKDNNNIEYLSLKSNWGFYSKKDLQQWTAQICEDCVDTKLSFIKFKKEKYNPLLNQ